jgi:Arc/MetJ-type ribon-helix-helix transcriptional regulator
MSEAESPPEKTTVNIRMTETFLDDIDATWEEQGFNSRSEFVRAVLRDALKHPDFNRADLKAMLASESEIREGRTHSSDDVKAEYGLDETARDSDE